MRNAFRILWGECQVLASESNVVLGRSRAELAVGMDPGKPATVLHIRTHFQEQSSRLNRV